MAVKCGIFAAFRLPSGDVFIGRLLCGRTRRCSTCAKLRALSLVKAIAWLAENDQRKLVFITVTFKPSLGVTMLSAPAWRNRIAQAMRRHREVFGNLVYVCALEAHKSGKPHFHFIALAHGVRKARDIMRAAVHGSFVNAKLVDTTAQAIAYVGKYASKGGILTCSRLVSKAIAILEPPSGAELVAIADPLATFEEFVDSLIASGYNVINAK
jgi:hypothetical protein